MKGKTIQAILRRFDIRRLVLAIAVAAIAVVLNPSAGLAHHAAGGHMDSNPRKGLNFKGLEKADKGPCKDALEIRADNGRLQGCTHGPDPAPAGVDMQEARSISELYADAPGQLAPPTAETTSATSTAPGLVPCVGDGISGNRVQAIYARASDRPSRYDYVKPLIGAYAGAIDRSFNDSAAETGGERHLRFVTDPGCSLNVANVTLSTAGDDDFGTMLSELRAKGYTRSDRKYLVWMDANPNDTFADYCGLGHLIQDDTPSQSNLSNGVASQPGFVGRVDPGCWGGHAEAHELIHTLGGVQGSAPNSTGGHCTDESDIMCYDDDGAGPVTMRSVCDSSHERLLDCRHDDYFHTNPGRYSYLSSHWNVARSSFLTSEHIDVPSDTTPPTVRAPRQAISRSGVISRASAVANTLIPMNISWPATDDLSGIKEYHVWRSVDSGPWQHVMSGSNPSVLSSLAGGHTYQYTVLAIDGSGNQSSWVYGAPFAVTVIDGPDPRIRYSGTWSDRASYSNVGASTRVTTQNGARATVSFYGSEIAWIGTTQTGSSTTVGRADIFVDGVRAGNVSMAASGAQVRIIGTMRWNARGSHTTVVQKTSGNEINMDAVVVVR